MKLRKLPIPRNNQLENYPLHDEFEEILNSCGSMTRNLEKLGHELTVNLLFEGIISGKYHRVVTLNLDVIPVVLACSTTDRSNEFFYQLLKNADITPIGKFLFAKHSGVERQEGMQLQLLKIVEIFEQKLCEQLKKYNYSPEQKFWLRQSIFNYADEKLYLSEIILPELDYFF